MSNLVINPSAETGDLTGWSSAGVSVTTGGSNGTNCFQFIENAYMGQNLGAQNALAIFEVSADFKPSVPWEEASPLVGAYVLFELQYEDGTKDCYTLALRTETIVDNGFLRARLVAATRESASATEAYFRAFSSIPGQFDNFIVQQLGEGNSIQEGVAYYGVTISKARGLEIKRSDGLSEAVFNSDTFAMRALDDLGVMQDKIYFDPVNGTYIFDGTLSATTINAIEAQIDVVVSDTIIVNNLYAQRGHIAELTVDMLDTSNKLARFNAADVSQMFFLRIHEQRMEFIEASTTGVETQLLDRYARPLYWLDDTKTQTTLDVTTFPIMVYSYTESKKLQMFFTLDPESGFQIPMMVWGAGVLGPDDENGKGFLFKDATGFVLRYVKADGVPCEIRLGEDGMGLSCGSDMEYCEYAEFDWAASIEMTLVNAYTHSCVVTTGVIGAPADFGGSAFNLVVERIKEVVGGQECFSKVRVTPTGSSVPSPVGAKIAVTAICRGVVSRTVV